MKKKTYVEYGSLPRLYMTAVQLAEYEGKSATRCREIIHEIEKEVQNGRYPATAVGSAPLQVNYFVYRDYATYKSRLANKILRKNVPPFDAAEIAKICPVIKQVIILDDNNITGGRKNQ